MLRNLLMSTIALSAPVLMQTAHAASNSLQGSDTMAGYMSDIIVATGLEQSLVYQGGGSGLGEAALVAKTQGIAAMSRAFKAEQLAAAAAAGLNIQEHVVGLDGVGIFVNASNATSSLTLEQVKKIFSCEITNWSELGAADLAITAYRRNDNSGTTDTFKSLVGLKTFGACVKVLAETSDIAYVTANESSAVGYSGLSAGREGNKDLALSKDASSQAFSPSPANIRSFKYPLSRKLYVYEALGATSEAEKTLLQNILDRSFSDPILQDNEFFTLD
ncbi:MAG: substrate-binding domain-containing protein [Proteobacteria bacterium]|nr:substrate-binding domain-containing protein [Pseudomonadota bacterium]